MTAIARMRTVLTRPELMVIASALFATAGQVILKYSLHRDPASLGAHGQELIVLRGVLLGLSVYGIGTVLWLLAVSKRAISYLYPLASISYLLVVLSAHFFLNEPIHTDRWVGIGLMTLGIGLLTYGAPEERPQ